MNKKNYLSFILMIISLILIFAFKNFIGTLLAIISLIISILKFKEKYILNTIALLGSILIILYSIFSFILAFNFVYEPFWREKKNNYEYTENLEKELEKKYNQDFVITKTSGIVDYLAEGQRRATGYSINGKYANAEFNIIYDEKGLIGDNYLDFEAGDLVSEILSKQYFEQFYERSLFLTKFESLGEYFNLSEIKNLNTYLSDRTYFITSYMFIESDLTNELLSKKIYDYAKSLESLNYNDLCIIVLIVNDIDDVNFNKFYQMRYPYDEYKDQTNTKKITGFQLSKGKLKTYLEDIQKELKIKSI